MFTVELDGRIIRDVEFNDLEGYLNGNGVVHTFNNLAQPQKRGPISSDTS
jgi:hypothetical protein